MSVLFLFPSVLFRLGRSNAVHALHVCNWVNNEQLYPQAAVVPTACSENLQRSVAPVAENGSLLRAAFGSAFVGASAAGMRVPD